MQYNQTFLMRKIILLFLCIVFIDQSFAQPLCAFDEKMEELVRANPDQARIYRENERKIRDYIAAHPPVAGKAPQVAYTIPVVVHVMHTGGAVGSIYNPSDANIQAAVNYLNRVYAGTYAGLEAPVGGTSPVNLELQFAFAQRTPTCGFTNGIDRVDASSLAGYTTYGVRRSGSNGCTDLQLKDFARWNPADYYNVWVVNKIDGADGTSGQFVAGYAYFAGSASSLDGTVMLATQMYSGNKVLPHEIGHAFNLYHTFQGSNLNTSCPTNTTCSSEGDMICDTDPVTNNVNSSGVYDFSCRTGTNSCTGTAYTKNTEKNFMAYTNCFTVFTDGQKARVQAAMSLPSRASFITSLATVPCGTSINFTQATDSKTEPASGTVTGCRKYTDYTYQLVIGAGPTANATVTLVFGGTATKGVDYEATTNGKFNAPSNTLVFDAGSTASKSFAVRIYDDASTESSETIDISFTLNNGGGDATIGTSVPSMSITITDNDLAPIAPSTITAGVGTFNASLSQPFRGSYFDSRTQVLYTAAELTALGLSAGNITSIGFTVTSKGSTQPYSGFTIKLKNTTTTGLSTGTFEAGATTVYTGNYSTVSGLNTIPITPFAWDGTSNLLVDCCFDNSTGTADDLIQGATGTANSYYDRQNTNATAGCSIASGTVTFSNAARPIFLFTITTTGNPIATALNSTATRYLGPNEDVYFYDASGNVMARIKNLSSFDYGCTSVTIDRSGNTTSQFWNNAIPNNLAQKSLKVVPTNNTTSGSYQITLYYTATEISNWQTATGLTLSVANVVKVSNGFFVPDVTPAVPHIADVSMVANTSAAFASGYAITGNFSSTGFSGFGVGVPGNPLLTADFRTKATGNFSDGTIWEYNSSGSTYTAANKAPGADNNSLVQAAHTVTLDAGYSNNTGKTLTVNGTLLCGTNIVSGAGNFVLSAAGTLGIGSAAGINSSGATGNIQTTGRTFSSTANYTYNGSVSQSTGNGIPLAVNNLSVANTGASGSNTVSLAKAIIVNGVTNLSSGFLAIAGYTLTINGAINYGTGLLIGSPTSNLSIGGNAGTLKFDQSALSNYSLDNLYLTGTGNATVGSPIISAKSVNLSPGTNLRVLSGNNLQTN